MANLFLRSTDGSDADNGTTWALAKATFAGVGAINAAGDVIYVSDNHAEAANLSISWTSPATANAPTRVLCGDDSAEPPTALAATAVIDAGTGARTIVLNGYAYFYGIIFKTNAGASSGSAQSITIGNSAAPSAITFEDCEFWQGGSSSSNLTLGANSASSTDNRLVFKNCGFRFGNAGSAITATRGVIRIEGGHIISGGASITGPFIKHNGMADVLVTGFDFTNLPSACDLVGTNIGSGKVVFRNCKLPNSWTGGMGTPGDPSHQYEMYNCDDGDTNYKMRINQYAGTVLHNTSNYRNGGASDGTTPHSWNLVSNANCNYPDPAVRTPEIMIWNETVGSAITITAEIITNAGVTLTDGEFWMEVRYLGTSGRPLGLYADNAKADVLASASNHPSSSATWTTSGLSSPVKQSVSVTVTPEEKGPLIVRFVLAKPSVAMYVDPKLTIS